LRLLPPPTIVRLMSLAYAHETQCHATARFADGLVLECGQFIAPLDIAYTTQGRLNSARSNAVLVCHALTGDQHVVGPHPANGRPGWWTAMVGPGRPIDTDRWFVVCTNVLGGCMGSTGPSSINPATGSAWASDFPPITIGDMVAAQARLVFEHLGIPRIFAVIGGSMGGMQVLEWTVRFPAAMAAAVPIATAHFHSAQNIAFHEVGRQAIAADPSFHRGRYQQHGVVPERGLAVARMCAHITYLSEAALTRKFGRRWRGGMRDLPTEMFEVESYLQHQGASFVRRFDANSYLAITRAMDLFDLSEDRPSLADAFRATRARFCVVSFSSDWLFPTARSRELVRALHAVAASVSFVEIETDKGHDAFLLDEPDLHRTVSGFLSGVASREGVGN
jgi:homoserine O-acetyltransferase